jgi:hypothetical protein
MTRYKIDALAELGTIEGSIKSRRKTLRDTANAATAATTESLLRTLEANATALRAEVATLPDRPPLTFAYTDGGNDWKRPCPVAPDDPIFDTLEIPAFLRRAA